MKIIVGGIVEKNGKILLVQEAKEKCYGKWNIPAGKIKLGERLTEGAIREIKEETGCDVELTGIASICYGIIDDTKFMSVVFSTKLLSEEIKFNQEEILDVQWYDIDKVTNEMNDKLRNCKLIKHAVLNLKNKNISTLDVINEF